VGNNLSGENGEGAAAAGANVRLGVETHRSACLQQRSRALSSLQWMQAVPRKPYTMFLPFLSEFE
jgi:hypothetical protein